MLELLKNAFGFLQDCFKSRHRLAFENLALRTQLAQYREKQEKGIMPKPRCTPGFRLTWILLSRFFAEWKDALCVVKPETVIRWHKRGFQVYWRNKSTRRKGRPVVSVEVRRLIKNIHADNSLWSPERIHDQLADLGYNPPSPNTIRKYLPKSFRDTSKSAQTWKMFIKNHIDTTWAADFFVVPTLTFQLLYVFVVVSHERREIIRFGVMQHPTMLWVIQQLREATGFGIQPRYLIRDNDSIYGGGVPQFLARCRIEEVRTSYCSPWQNAYCERVIGTLRRELFDHIIPLNEWHLHRLLKEYIDNYYHAVRTHSSLDHRPPIVDTSLERHQFSP